MSFTLPCTLIHMLRMARCISVTDLCLLRTAEGLFECFQKAVRHAGIVDWKNKLVGLGVVVPLLIYSSWWIEGGTLSGLYHGWWFSGVLHIGGSCL